MAVNSTKKQAGFTLIELLIVITIIAVLAMLTTVMVSIARKQAAAAAVKSDISGFKLALAAYRDDEGIFPGHAQKWDEDDEYFNAFPDLFEAILGQPRSKGGKGGKNAPYWEDYKEDKVVVMVDPDNPSAGFQPPLERSDLNDVDVPKFYEDQFGNPYIYRENDTKKPEPWMWKAGSYDLWSCGPDGKNDSMWAADAEENDDIGSWN
ncbi:MAG: prepilin-type N-terminal cleavage/methylation domain-containing protein [Planctomycetota bacterium]